MDIALSPDTYKRLQNLMKPYENAELVIRRLLDSYEGNGDEPESETVPPRPDESGTKPPLEEIVAGPMTPSGWNSGATPDVLDPGWEEWRRVSPQTIFTPQKKNNPMEFGKDNLVPLKHTKILEASINGEWIENPRWISLIRYLILFIHRRDGLVREDLHPQLLIKRAKIMDSKKGDGYKWVPGTDISFQGVNSDNSWQVIRDLAIELGLSVEILFGWRNKPGSLYPNKCGRFRINAE